jgi:hypothetical protein
MKYTKNQKKIAKEHGSYQAYLFAIKREYNLKRYDFLIKGDFIIIKSKLCN